MSENQHFEKKKEALLLPQDFNLFNNCPNRTGE